MRLCMFSVSLGQPDEVQVFVSRCIGSRSEEVGYLEQETVNYTIHVAASSASTEDSTVVQETGILLQWRLL